LAEAGATVACIDIDEGRAKGTADAIIDMGGKAFPIVGDMTDSAQVERAMDEAVAEMGGIDICVDIIGASSWEEAHITTDTDWEWSITNNLNQVFYILRGAGRRMVDQNTGGAMVALASTDGITSSAYHAPYGAAKAGVISLVKTFAEELGHWGIRVDCIAPGNPGHGTYDLPPAEYDVNGVNPLAQPRPIDIANGVLFLVSDLASRISGHTIPVDGGATIQSLWGKKREGIPGMKRGQGWPDVLRGPGWAPYGA
jgi:3-oxoacyl-[acyl-carrier protein] reductase